MKMTQNRFYAVFLNKPSYQKGRNNRLRQYRGESIT